MPTILIVDDDRTILKFCTHILMDFDDLNILKAADVSEAVDLARRYEGAIDLLLSDIAMPGEWNGIQLAKTLSDSRPEMKVLLMSGFSYKESDLTPGWRFLSKPFRPATLLAKIEEALGRTLENKVPTKTFGAAGRVTG
jgi:DNA-binding NtrC family response regulator